MLKHAIFYRIPIDQMGDFGNVDEQGQWIDNGIDRDEDEGDAKYQLVLHRQPHEEIKDKRTEGEAKEETERGDEHQVRFIQAILLNGIGNGEQKRGANDEDRHDNLAFLAAIASGNHENNAKGEAD